MQIIINCEPKEIASLVLKLQGKPDPQILVTGRKTTPEDRRAFVDSIKAAVESQIQDTRSRRQPYPTSPEQTQDEESQPD